MVQGRRLAEDLVDALLRPLFGEQHYIYYEGVRIFVPKYIWWLGHSPQELTREQRIAAIAESTWARGWARGIIEKFFPGEFVNGVRAAHEARVARLLAEKVVG